MTITAREFIEQLDDLAEVDEVDRVIKVGLEGLSSIVRTPELREAVDPTVLQEQILAGLLGYVDPNGERWALRSAIPMDVP